MPKVFYVGGGTHSRGMLRAVVSTAELVILTVGVDLQYLGNCFPDNPYPQPGVLVEVSVSEANCNWLKGFYRLEISPALLDEKLRSLPQTLEQGPEMRSGTPLAQPPDFFHRLLRSIQLGSKSCD